MSLKVIDYQMYMVGHPTIDLGYFLYISTNLAFRKAYLDDLLRIYYNLLISYMTPHEELSFEDFKAEFDARRAVYLIGGFYVCSIGRSKVSKV